MTKAPSLRRIWIFTAFIVMFQLGLVQAMAASGAFHKRCHDHADDPAHKCAVTLMLHGGYQNTLPDIVPVVVFSEPPAVPVYAPKPCDIAPAHLVGGVLAQAPPRGP
jgi:hypothetical protein